MESLYDLMDTTPEADSAQLKAAFRKKVKELHPDMNPQEDSSEAFQEMSAAYDLLSDPAKRRAYDRKQGITKMGFFVDVEDEDSPSRPSPFRWSRMTEDEDDDDSESDEAEEGEGPTDEQLLEQLYRLRERYPDQLSQWQQGVKVSWGTSTSDVWRQRVQRESGGSDYGDSGDETETPQFNPMRRRDDLSREPPGWAPPGQRRDEWRPPGRGQDPEGPRPGQDGGRRAPGRGTDDGVRHPFRI